ncbi:MAG: hypothetical protein EZS28_025264 [Streblomastix strix]|uniref:Uncharacterized protein n=1 Tax=Streblomastix strix TaxID=222440 RepID=A0A5J4V9J4_9EUKA|nr:MAG: hypothetical protein EZS28_025264 [Streblomastix strix]
MTLFLTMVPSIPVDKAIPHRIIELDHLNGNTLEPKFQLYQFIKALQFVFGYGIYQPDQPAAIRALTLDISISVGSPTPTKLCLDNFIYYEFHIQKVLIDKTIGDFQLFNKSAN